MILELTFLWPFVFLGLYAPPIWVATGQRLLTKHPPPIRFLKDLTLMVLFLASVGLTVGFGFGEIMPMWTLAIIGIPFKYPYMAILMHLSFVYILLHVGTAKGWSPALTFSLAVYGVFAIGELWEWPIHYISAQTDLLKTLVFAAPKLIALPLFFYALVKRMWLPSAKWLGLAALVALAGVPLIGYGNPVVMQLYRVPWIALLLLAVRSTP